MLKVGIFVNREKDEGFAITKEIINWLLINEFIVYIPYDLKIRHSNLNIVTKDLMYSESDFIIVLGGDGTILGIARGLTKYDTPILGVNLGNLGFITEVEIKDIYTSLESIKNGNYSIEERMMIQADVYRDKTIINTLYALNDVCITRGHLLKLVKLNAYVGKNFIDKYNADGLLISTPTGSTAYSLSAGGPIVSPTMSLMLITPICPHSLKSRTIVVSDKDDIIIEVSEHQNGEVYLTADGQEVFKLLPKDKIHLIKAQCSLKLIKTTNRSFYDILRSKLKDR
ncbi:NAD(+)/NADH kinase [Caloramator sp. mosi_1]|uniref:NAD(+)/NADH kinase n=1 Tax=Caloramator sp. mosi_1 TaxID=3023090 RepID=UPI00235F1F7C|nr:NAD(+)/NADH kinase [Caloramator sp. mosi_1]WDC83795.1 NAD(+)/NADH kinase [Caloramator sp. mosi_1]